MSILCSICQDFLTERPQVLSATDTDDLAMCALRCGHLFHLVCVQQWFHCRGGASQAGIAQLTTEGSCPCCKKAGSLTDAIRIFPTGDEDSNDIVQHKRNLETAFKENEKLTSTLEDVNELLSRASSELEEEIVAHDMLKMEYGQAISSIDALKDQIKDNMDIRTALENSLKTEIEKLEKEKADALRTIMEMEAREKKFIEEMESLRVDNAENIQLRKIHPRESSIVHSMSKGINMMLKGKSNLDDTSDGESPSASPPSSQANQLFIATVVPYSHHVDESNQSDCD